MAPHLIRTNFMARKDGIDDWVDATGRIVLLGDAAHPSFVRLRFRTPASPPVHSGAPPPRFGIRR